MDRLCEPKSSDLMSSSDLEMSLEHQQLPVDIKKTQMSGERAGSQCGLTSLLPMSCRGRAVAFARDLQSRLRNLSGTQDDDCENAWLARDSSDGSSQRLPGNTTREHDTFYDFELECESPSSPVDDIEPPPFLDRSPVEDSEPPFYDGESDPEIKEQAKQKLHDGKRNGFRFATSFYTDSSPVKSQPAPRENGHVDKRLYSPITFEGCARQNSIDEIDCFSRPSQLCTPDVGRLGSPIQQNSTVDSDSEFESAKSEPSDGADEVFSSNKHLDNDVTEAVETLSLADAEIPTEEEAAPKELIQLDDKEKQKVNNAPLEILTSEVPAEKEVSPAPEIESTLLSEIPTDTEEEAAPKELIIQLDDKEKKKVNNNKPLEIITSEVPEKEVSPAPEIESTLLSAQEKADEDNLEDHRPQRVRRCSSLKTGKTPPGTPGRKKIVRFADVLGLDLADVKTFLDEIPVIPKSAYDDLTGCDVASSPPVRAPQRYGSLTLVPLFQLPRELTDKIERLNTCLESARVCDGVHVTVCGSVRVRNLDFHKTVHIRYTMNKWKTYTDLQATYVQGSCDGYSDRFQFTLYVPCITSGQRLELAVRFLCKGQQFWDNNSGANYCFDCLALGASGMQSSPSGPLHPTVDWHPSFY